jgi:predicted DNA binding protein
VLGRHRTIIGASNAQRGRDRRAPTTLIARRPTCETALLKEIRFSFQHDNCWLQETTQRYNGVTLVVSAVYQSGADIHIDLFVHAPNPQLSERVWQEWKSDKRIKKITKLYEGPKGVRFHVSYDAKNSIYPHIIHHTPISLGSINMAVGVEYYSLIGESEDIQQLLQTLNKEGTTKVISIKTLQETAEPAPTADGGLLAELTDKQIEALILAHAEGYYNWPRVLSASDLAAHVGLSSAAFLDHLRRAEAKALDGVIRQIKLQDPARFEAVKARLGATKARTGAAKR